MIGAGYYIWQDFTKDVRHSVSNKIPDLDRPINTQEEMARDKIEELSNALKQNSSLADHWLELASYRKLIGDYEASREIWEYMTTKWPDDNKAFLNLGNLYGYYLHDFPKAEEYFLKALEKNPYYIVGCVTVYEFYKDTEKPDLALEIIFRSLEKSPLNVDLLSVLGKHYKDEGDIESARKYYEMALVEVRVAGDEAMAEQFKQQLDNL